MRRALVEVCGIVALIVPTGACSGEDARGRAGSEVRVAVAANFADAHAELAERFTERTGVAVRTSIGSTGQLYAQIVNGAPFDAFLAADTARPARLEAEGLAVRGSRFTYAEGRLALYAPKFALARTAAEGGVGDDSSDTPRAGAGSASDASPPGQALPGLDVLRATADPVTGEGRRLAIANPRLAPYGMAARQALVALGLWDALEERIVMAENIGQAFQFVESAAAELGLVAASYVRDAPITAVWPVPTELYDPIRQDAVRLETAADTAAARAYIEFLRSGEARRIIGAAGYGVSGLDGGELSEAGRASSGVTGSPQAQTGWPPPVAGASPR